MSQAGRYVTVPARAIRVAGVLTVGAAAAWSVARASATPSARIAHSASVKDEAHLRLVKSSGSLLIDEGPVSGTIPGRARVHFVYDGNPTVSAQITIFGRAGSINAHGTGRLSNPASASPSFKGTLTISGGSGRYLHAHGGGKLFGVFYRRSYGLLVQTEGKLQY